MSEKEKVEKMPFEVTQEMKDRAHKKIHEIYVTLSGITAFEIANILGTTLAAVRVEFINQQGLEKADSLMKTILDEIHRQTNSSELYSMITGEKIN